MPFQPKDLNEQLIRETTESKVASIAPRRDIWKSVEEEVLRPKARPRLPWSRLLATVGAVLTVIIAITAAQVVSWYKEDGRSSSPLVAVAEAYEGLLSLETVRYRTNAENAQGERFVVSINEVDIANQIIYKGSWLEGSDPAADHPSMELLVTGGKQYGRLNGGVQGEDWLLIGEVGHWTPFGILGGLQWQGEEALAESFEEIERLPAEVLNGKLVEHYLARRTVGESPETTEDTVEFWVDARDGLMQKVVWLHQERWSDPGVDIDLDKDWCENADGHYPEGQSVMVVMYGQPGSSDLIISPSPGHSLQVMEIVCAEDLPENWKPGGKSTTVWRRSSLLPGEEGHDLTVRWTHTFTGFNQPLTLPDPLPGR